MRVLVTGGSGFIGSNFIRFLIEKYPNHEIVNSKQLNTWNNEEVLEHNDKNRVIGSFIYNSLLKYRKQSRYEIDGIIVSHNKIYPTGH